MIDYEQRDFNIDIKKIRRVWYHVTPNWKREKFEKRYCHGLLFILSGKIQCEFGTFKVVISEGDLVKFPKTMPYSGDKLADETFSCIVIDFETYDDAELEKFNMPIVYRPADVEMFKKLFLEIEELWRTNVFNLPLLAKSSLYNIFGLIANDIHGLKNKKKSRVLDYIGLNIDNPNLCCASICKRFFISESTLRRDIVCATGFTPKEYIIMRRINMAKSLLINNREKKINQIAEECGFRSQYYFSNSFKKLVGISPTAYREKSILFSI